MVKTTLYMVKTTLCMVKTIVCSPKDLVTWMGMIPGMMGQLIPMARQSSTNFLKVAALKKSWVTMKSAPASTFSLGEHYGSVPEVQESTGVFQVSGNLPEVEQVVFIRRGLRVSGGVAWAKVPVRILSLPPPLLQL